MASYWTGYRMGMILADLSAAGIAMLVVGSIGILLGPPAASIAVAGLLALAFMRQARKMAEGGPMNTMLPRTGRMIILDAAGKQRVRIDGNGIQLTDDAGRTRIVMAVDANGPELQIRDQNGNLQVSLGSRPDGNSGLALMDEGGKVRAQAVIRKELGGIASFCLHDSAGQVRGNFAVGDGPASLNFADDQGVILWSSLRGGSAGHS